MMILPKIREESYIGNTMTQNTTKNDKREQCDTKHNSLKIIYLKRQKIYSSVSYPVPPAHAPASVSHHHIVWEEYDSDNNVWQ